MSFFCINCRSGTDPGFKACPYCGDPITDFLRKYTEEPIDGKYRILSRLGIGGMGEVYKVLHLHLNAPRVVKMMRPSLSGDARAHQRFIREAQLATRIQHPNVASLFDFSTLQDGSYYMVWEYIDGITVADLLRAGEFLSPRYAALLSLQVLDGLQAIHRQGVVHRDVSPENVMITFDDEGSERVKIIDLGIAKQWTNETDDKTKTGMFIGKWKYCSPEHLGMLKPTDRIDGRADIYSYGIVLYELLTGRVPFIADSPHRFLLLHSTESPPSLIESNPKLGELSELESILFRALEKDREKRFRTARQFAAALAAILPSLPDAPGMPTGAASPRIATGEGSIDTLEEAQGERVRAGSDEETVDEKLVDAATADTVEASALEIPDVEAPFFVGNPHATNEIPVEDPDATVESLRLTDVLTPAEETEKESSGEGFAGIARRTLARAPLEDEPRTETPARVWIGLVALAVLAILLTTYLARREPDVSLPPEPEIVEEPAPPARQTVVGIHAWPWGQIQELKNLDTGELVKLEDVLTPLALDLEPGHYVLILSNPSYPEQIERSFEVRPGERNIVHVQFEPAESAELPDLGGGA